MKQTVYLSAVCMRVTYHTYDVEIREGETEQKAMLRLYQFLEENGVNVSDSVQGIECIAHDMTDGDISYDIKKVEN